MSEINVTTFLRSGSMIDYSASIAEIGPSAGSDTWRASIDGVAEFNFLPTDDMLQEFREWLKPWGAWDNTEIATMSDEHLRALCLQWIAADWRECFGDQDPGNDNWKIYHDGVMNGDCPSSFSNDPDGQIFWHMQH